MGRSRYKIIEPTAPHFMTMTTVNWLPIFTRPATVQLLLDSFTFLQKNQGLKLYGFVVLENHLHCVAQSSDLAKSVHSFKSFTAKRIIQYLESQKETRLLTQLAFHKKAHKKDRQYQLWEEGVHPQCIQNEEMLRQKLEYIHLNPVKRGYVAEAKHWRYSSAGNYEVGCGLIEVFCDW
ncbi:MAG: hypothetical protein PF495_17230 [Spirochaetales bacterium]|jgi:putative transposase|nr:hypothetical protein [Spirochaetales bacterium]